MNTTITIENEHGKHSVSVPTKETFDDIVDMFVLASLAAKFQLETIEKGIIEKAEEIKEG